MKNLRILGTVILLTAMTMINTYANTGGVLPEPAAMAGVEDWQEVYRVNDANDGNCDLMTAEEQSSVTQAIASFKRTYMKPGMSDLDKELVIIQWLVENSCYEKTDDGTDATAYGCIINGKAKCAGYADAFLQTAKACGLEARYVYNDEHAWNLVKIEDQWYHTDVSWEDPLGDPQYGFGRLRNKYINISENQIQTVRSHYSWYPVDITADGTTYGTGFITQYMEQ